jgi:hypothetical protein
MSEQENTTEAVEVEASEPKTEFAIEIKITNQNLSYKSDFSESETVFWLEAVKSLVLQKSFELTGLSQTSN